MNWRVCPPQNVAGLIKIARTDIFLNGQSIFTSPGWVWNAGAAATLVLSCGSPWAGCPRGAWTWCLCRGAIGYSHCPAPAVAPLLGLPGLGGNEQHRGLSRGDGRSCPSPGGCQGLGEVSRGTGVYGFPTAPGPSDRCSPIDPFDRHRWVSAAPGPRSCRGEMGGGGSHPPPAVPPPWCRAGRARCSAAVRRVPGGLRGGIYSPLPAAAAPLAVVQSCH